MDPTEPPLVFATAWESLYERGLKGRLTPELREMLRGHGVDFDRPLLPAYSLDAWAQALCATAEALYPALPLEEGTKELGKATFLGLKETAIGKAMFPLLRLLGPKRVLRRMTRSLRNGSNFIDTKLLREGDQDAAIWFNHVRQVGFYQGVLETALLTAGAQEAHAELGAREGMSIVYELRWR